MKKQCPMATMLEVNNLQVSFPSKNAPGATVKALHGVNLSIKKGEIVSLVGESGCGKSMTGLAILNLVSPPGKVHSGNILFEDNDILSFSEEELLQLVDDAPELYPTKTE